MKILIVEDDEFSKELLRLTLSKYGTCDLAENGAEAIAAVEKAMAAGKPYDLACMDIMMPEMDGMEALKKIRQLEFKYYGEGLPSTKIIMVTAKGQARDITDAMSGGCEAYLTKPVDRVKLIEQMRELGLLGKPNDNNPDKSDPDSIVKL